jgi:AraC-like DNA-binding protein
MDLSQLTFSLHELLSLIGIAQCSYVMVYMLFRAGGDKRAILPFIYFMALGIAFFLDFYSKMMSPIMPHYDIFQWGFWFIGPPLSVLLVIQIAQITKLPPVSSYWVLFLLPAAFLFSYGFASTSLSCDANVLRCETFKDWLNLTGLWAGALSMFAIWTLRGILNDLYSQKEGKARYWLVLTLVIVNLFFLTTMLLSQSSLLTHDETLMIRTIFGIAFAYLASTSLFRIYPQAMILLTKSERESAMSEEEKAIATQIEELIDVQKVYHEVTYGRADMARELKVSETIISRVINVHFGKNLPQLLNERRVEDAKRLLAQTDEPMKVIAEEVGFNSLASFNRVFREFTTMSPSEFRDKGSFEAGSPGQKIYSAASE